MSTITLTTQNISSLSIQEEFPITNTTTASQEVILPFLDNSNENTNNINLPHPHLSTQEIQENLYSLPSMGANVLALLTAYSAEQKRITQEQKAIQTELAIQNIHDQAQAMKQKAIAQLCMGIVSGTLSIAQGITTTTITTKNTQHFDNVYKNNGKLHHGIQDMPKTRSSAETTLNAKTQMINSSFSATQTIFNNISQTIATYCDADMKKLEANLEHIHALKESLSSLENSFKDLIDKILQTQDLMQQQINQTRIKILG